MTTETATDSPATEPDPRQQTLLQAEPSPARELAHIERQRAMAETTFGGQISPFSNGDAFKLACAIAERIAMSSLIPEDYRGKPENILVAMDYAARLPGCNVLMVMQNMDVVKGRPGLRGTFLSALINRSPLFTRLRYEWRGTDNPGKTPTEDFGCRAYATEVATGEVVYGTWIDWRMVVAEGWNANKKWTSMREQMFQYRAASFWSRVNASDITLGLYEAEELRDAAIIDGEFSRVPSRAQRLNDATDLPRDPALHEADEQHALDGAAEPAPVQEEVPTPKPRGKRRAVRTEGDPPPETTAAPPTEQQTTAGPFNEPTLDGVLGGATQTGLSGFDAE